MTSKWGRFTARGGAQVEERIGSVVDRVAAVVREALPAQDYRALVLIGGYGRGEGGIARCGAAEVPHNNLDFLLVTTQEGASQSLKLRLDALLEPVSEAAGVRIDLSITSVPQLKRARPLVIWCDMRHGHKTVLGDPAFVPGLTHLQIERILPADVRNLLVNRGTLLIINHLLIERQLQSADHRRLMIRHAFKAIIGYGDALLFQFGDYAWSYAEKQERMRRRSEIPDAFRQLYDEAMEFRFKSLGNESYLDRDLAGWMESLRAKLAPLHLRWESWRLGASLPTWEHYLAAAWRQALLEEPASPRSWARKAVNLVRGPPWPSTGPWGQRLAVRCSGFAGALSILFPVPAYGLRDGRSTLLAREILGAQTAEVGDLRHAYLSRWGSHVDTNFFALLRQLGITLEPGGKP